MFRSILIVGLGLIGGSIAMALKAACSRDKSTELDIYGADNNYQTCIQAEKSSLVKRAFQVDDLALDELLASNELDLVIMAMPSRFARAFFERVEKSGYSGCITDTSSTKTEICNVADEVLGDVSRFIPSHPMSGSEVNGLEGAIPSLFAGKYWILCPDEKTNEEMFLQLHSLLTSLGARTISIDRYVHDDIVAITSHVPHVVAGALVNLALKHSDQNGEIFRLTAGGFKDSTRIAAGSPDLWTDILLANKEIVSDSLVEISQSLSEISQILRDNDAQRLNKFLATASKTRKSIPNTWSSKSGNLTMLRISMENHVGVIANVTSIAGQCGCNIASIDIEHITESSAMLNLVLTDEGDLDSFIKKLKESGYDFDRSFVEV